MLVKLLGVLDMLSAMFFVFSYLGFFEKIGIVFGIYLIVKAVFLFGGMASLFDLLSGVVFFIFIKYGILVVLLWAAILWLSQKGFVSMFSFS